MKFFLLNHSYRQAVEEVLITLLPSEKHELTLNQDDADIISSFVTKDNTVASKVWLRYNGNVYNASRKQPADINDALSFKRTVLYVIREAVYLAVAKVFDIKPVWGSITGVRPAKSAAEDIRKYGEEFADNRLKTLYHVSTSRRKLALSCAFAELDADNSLDEKDVCLYVSIPFCPSRCKYCSFVSFTTEKEGSLIEPYITTLCKEISRYLKIIRENGRNVCAVYIGGGTPGVLTANQTERLLAHITQCVNVKKLREFTVEAGRPDVITEEKLEIMRKYGVDRISINPQSMNDKTLEIVGRRHTAADTVRAFETARKAGFDCINMDIIAGLSGEETVDFCRTVDEVIRLAPENLTVHTLTYKKGATLKKEDSFAANNKIKEMLNYVYKQAEKAEYLPYYVYRQKYMAGSFENTGLCKSGFASLYNIVMMEEIATVIACGAGSVSKLVTRSNGKITRLSNPKYPKEYIENFDTKLAENLYKLEEFFKNKQCKMISFSISTQEKKN